MKDGTLTNLEDQFSSKDLFDAFKVQLARDFEQGNFRSDFVATLEPDFNSIRKKIEFELQGTEVNNGFRLMPLLYRIDISEAQLKKYLEVDPSKNYLEAISELIIKRVLQKVVIKRYYSSNEEKPK